MLLEAKTAIVYGGAGSIGSAVARAYAGEGAHVFLAGRTLRTLDAVADAIRAAGGRGDTAQVDALDPDAVRDHAEHVAQTTGRIDIAFNAVGNDDLQGIALAELSYRDFIRPVEKILASQFHIARAVSAHMVTRRSGVILTMGGGREAIPLLDGAHTAWSAVTGLCRQLASELGPHGVRMAWLLSPGSPDADGAAADGVDEFATATLLNRRPTLDDVAHVATFLASDWARTMTATEINLTAGAVVD
jgi:3-oxoacyl-[acyl-carrier protein] reductase